MRRSTAIHLICENVQHFVVLSERSNRSAVFYRDSNVATVKMMEDDDDGHNLEAALDVVATHIKKEWPVMECKRRSYPSKISKEIAEEPPPDTVADTTKEPVHWWVISSLSHIITSATKEHPTPLQITLGVYYNNNKNGQAHARLSHLYVVRVMSCLASSDPLEWRNTVTDDDPSQWKDLSQS